jgi:Skp family chaperone for outer membrane proteins
VRIANILILTLATLISVNVTAEQPIMKIGIVAPDAALFNTEYALAEFKKIETSKEFSAMKSKFDGLLEEVKKLNTEIENKGMTWSAQQNQDAQKNMGFLRADIELIQKKLQSEQKALQTRVVKAMEDKIKEALQEMIKEEEITLLLRKETAIFGGANVDYTSKLIDRLNKKMK